MRWADSVETQPLRAAHRPHCAHWCSRQSNRSCSRYEARQPQRVSYPWLPLSRAVHGICSACQPARTPSVSSARRRHPFGHRRHAVGKSIRSGAAASFPSARRDRAQHGAWREEESCSWLVEPRTSLDRRHAPRSSVADPLPHSSASTALARDQHFTPNLSYFGP